jgi:DNA-binding MarR family transcriptional regulator
MLLIRNIWLDTKVILRLARQFIVAELEPLNISRAEGDILFLLLTGSNDLQQEQIADLLDIGKASVSRTISSLESKGFVVRTRQDTDKRAYIISLTKKALVIGAEVTGVYDRLYLLIRKGIANEKFMSIESLLTQITDNLKSVSLDNE